MKRIALLLPGLLALLPAPGSAKLRVMTTTSDLASLAGAVGGERVEVQSLTRGGQDPHFLEAKPSYMLDAHRADLYVAVGMDMETGYLPLILEGGRNARIQPGSSGFLDASTVVHRLEVPGVDLDRSMGDVHPQGNPHYWLDPHNARLVAGTIAARLAELDPPGAAEYRARLEAFEARLDRAMFGEALVRELGAEAMWQHQRAGDLAAWLEQQGKREALGGWAGRMAPYRGARIVTFHRSFPYFAHAFGLQVVDQLEPKPGIPPSPAHLVEVIRTIQKQQVRVILQEPFYGRKAAELVAARTGASVVEVSNSVGGAAGADDYLALLDQLVGRVADALERQET